MTSLLFVCTGNTCRSPLAAILARQEAERRNMDVRTVSAGTFAAEGAPASAHSISVAARRGADLSEHRSRPLDSETVEDADLILAMTPGHLVALRTEYGRELDAELVTDFLPADHEWRRSPVADPFGGGPAEYEEVARLLEECVSHLLDRLAEG